MVGSRGSQRKYFPVELDQNSSQRYRLDCFSHQKCAANFPRNFSTRAFKQYRENDEVFYNVGKLALDPRNLYLDPGFFSIDWVSFRFSIGFVHL